MNVFICLLAQARRLRQNGDFTWDFVNNPIGTDGRYWTMADYNSIDFQQTLYLNRMSVNMGDLLFGWPTLGLLNSLIDRQQY